MPKRTIADKIRATREARDMSRYALAKGSGVSQNGLRAIEEGTVSPAMATLEKLARAMDCKLVVEFQALKKQK